MKFFLFVSKNLYDSYGVKVIVNKILSSSDDIHICFDLNELESGMTVIPYGILEAENLLKHKNLSMVTALMVDAYSLGEFSNFKRYWNKKYIPFSYRVKCLLRGIKYSLIEYKIFKLYDRVMLVSYGDKSYYEKHPLIKKYSKKIVVIPNGVEIPTANYSHSLRHNEPLRIGCLSPWSGPSYYTLQYFLNEIWAKIPHDNLELIIAGWGLSEEKKNYIESFKNVKAIGSVEKLDDFYGMIDVSLITMFKKCGIINRVLDSFSYRIPVLSFKENLLAFKDFPDCCYLFDDQESFFSSVNDIRNNYSIANKKALMAFNYIKGNNDWDKNYKDISSVLL